MIEVSISIFSSIIGAIFGYYARSFIEKRDKKLERHSESIFLIKDGLNLVSSKQLSIIKDINLYIFMGKQIHELEDEAYISRKEDVRDMFSMLKFRIIENCEKLNSYEYETIDSSFNDIKDQFGAYIHECQNLKRVIEHKSFDQNTISLIKEFDKKLSNIYSKIMSLSHGIYK